MREVLVRQVVNGVLAVPELVTQTGLAVGLPEVKCHVGVWPSGVQRGVHSGHSAGPRGAAGTHLTARLQVEVGVLGILLSGGQQEKVSVVRPLTRTRELNCDKDMIAS